MGQYDLIVIGGGPAGYAGAIRAGQLGKKVACIEMERAGGTCLNWGCIPSKALLKSAELYDKMRHAEDYGFHCENVTVNFEQVMKRSRTVADKMGKGIEFLFKKNKVDYFLGKAQVSAPGTVTITEGKDKGKTFNYGKLLIATGCKARPLPNVEVDGKRVMTSREALAMTEMPKSIAILGAGAIGVEFAYFLNALGCEVTLVEMLPQILPIEDKEVSTTLTRAFKKQGIKMHVGTKAEDIRVGENSVKIKLVNDKGSNELEVESLLVAIGVMPNTEGLLADKVRLNVERGFISVDNHYKTNIPNVYAAGDIIGPPWLAHVATFEAVQAVNGIFGHSAPKKPVHVPGCTYCQPQVASIGLTEEQAKEKGLKVKIGKFPFMASGKAVAANNAEGFVKLITDEKHSEILGAHIIGPDATELIAEYALAVNLEATAHEIHNTIHAHPTLAEAMAEAAADVFDEAIHI
tara:strand:+ start:18341 stop:19729 length:1389 start_codon:yes stop_codon:yes gene_type:complete